MQWPYTEPTTNGKLRAAAKELRVHPDIIVSDADISNVFVIPNRKDDEEKLDDILHDPTKFRKIARNPISTLRTEVNK